MKKIVSGLVIGGILSTCVLTYAETTSWTADKATFKVMVRGTEYTSDTPAIAIDGSTYLPLRAMGEALGVSVDWNAELKQAEVGMSTAPVADTGTKTPLSDAEKAIWKKGKWKATKATFKVMVRGTDFVSDKPPIAVEGRTYLPLRALGDALGVSVDWNADLKQAEVDMKAAAATPNKATTELSAGTLSAVIGSVEAVAGKEIEVPINFTTTGLKGIMTSDFTISYNKDNLEFVEATPGDIVKDATTNFACNNLTAVGKIKFLYLTYSMDEKEAINTNGLFAKIKFKVKDTTKAGDNEIALFGNPTVGDDQLKLVKSEFKAGKITVK